MTSTSTGLPDRYRALDQIAPDEPTATGVIRSWRARDKVLNRDVAVRVHTPGGPSAREWITRALTAGGLATPALAMVYDAAENSQGTDGPGAAYVVNEWLEGMTLAERLESGPLSERDARNLVRRLAEGVAEAHRVGLAVGGLTPEHVVLRPGGLVGLLAVPAAAGTVQGDIAALGSLLEACLTGHWPGSTPAGWSPPISQPDLAALVRRARSTEPGAGLSSVTAMVALLGERRPTGHTAPIPAVKPDDTTDSGWLRRLRDRRDLADADAADAARAQAARAQAAPAAQAHRPPAEATRPVVLPVDARPAAAGSRPYDPADTYAVAGGYDPDGYDPGSYDANSYDAEDKDDEDKDDDGLLPWGVPAADGAGRRRIDPDRYDDLYADDEDEPSTRVRRRLAVVGLPVVALAVVIALAWWVGTNVITAASSTDDGGAGSVPPPSIGAPASSSAAPPPAGTGSITIASATVFDPGGDGEPENDGDVPQAFDGNPATSWSTLTYSGSADFGNLKDGVGLVLDLGSSQAVAGVTIVTDTPGASIEVRSVADPAGGLDSFPVVASGELAGTDALTFAQPVTSQYLLVWVTGLVQAGDGYNADLAEITVQPAG